MNERNAAIGKMIDEMLKLKDALVELAERGYVEPADCPIVAGHYDHYDTSAMLVNGGFGTYEWECPFCGEQFCT